MVTLYLFLSEDTSTTRCLSTLGILSWTNDEAVPKLRQRIEERWEPSEIVVISPDADEEMRFAHLDDEHDRVLFVWWD